MRCISALILQYSYHVMAVTAASDNDNAVIQDVLLCDKQLQRRSETYANLSRGLHRLEGLFFLPTVYVADEPTYQSTSEYLAMSHPFLHGFIVITLVCAIQRPSLRPLVVHSRVLVCDMPTTSAERTSKRRLLPQRLVRCIVSIV